MLVIDNDRNSVFQPQEQHLCDMLEQDGLSTHQIRY